MKRMLIAALTVVGLALPQTASADDCFCFGFGFRVRACVKLNFCFEPCGGCPSYYPSAPAPWYTYFPSYPVYNAPTTMYPHWPQHAQAAPAAMPGVQNTSYYTSVPHYWYGR